MDHVEVEGRPVNSATQAVAASSTGWKFSLRRLLLVTAVACFVLAPIRWLGAMYLASLIISLVLLAGVCAGLRLRSTALALLACITGFVPLFFLFGSLVVIGQAIGTAVVVIATAGVPNRVHLRLAACVTMTAGVYCAGLAWAAHKVAEFDARRAAYPMVDLAPRLDSLKPLAWRPKTPGENQVQENQAVKLADDIEIRLSTFEKQRSRTRYWSRRRALEQLHSDTQRQFIAAQGFGVTRMLYMNPELLPASATASLPLRIRVPGVPAIDSPLSVHDALLNHVFDADSIGYVASWRRAAGFASHGFRTEAADCDLDPAEQVRVTRLELVSLLRHNEPRIYVTGTRLQMDELENVPTRPLDAFEASVLPALLQQSDLEYRRQGRGLRMLGAIRAADDCLDCHDTPRGTLLGAFSYEIAAIVSGGD